MLENVSGFNTLTTWTCTACNDATVESKSAAGLCIDPIDGVGCDLYKLFGSNLATQCVKCGSPTIQECNITINGHLLLFSVNEDGYRPAESLIPTALSFPLPSRQCQYAVRAVLTHETDNSTRTYVNMKSMLNTDVWYKCVENTTQEIGIVLPPVRAVLVMCDAAARDQRDPWDVIQELAGGQDADERDEDLEQLSTGSSMSEDAHYSGTLGACTNTAAYCGDRGSP